MTRPLAQQARMINAANDELTLRPVRAKVDFDAINRIEAYAAGCRAEIGDARWAQLQAEWNA